MTENERFREALERISTAEPDEPSAVSVAIAIEALDPGHFARLTSSLTQEEPK